ncbi:unnamed protein product [Anisakis simplex]|uniref:G_PROTEIN_RECEP_F1_2 domain-containing protein n=1 Tax=Anisakis simplex TaxID=6269 RepID=A0A0M3IYI3_ANISI|nr:unnamed protein product [Anisakis simplex]
MDEPGQFGVCLNNSQCRVISISAQVPLSWALPLYGYVMPFIVTVTLATNSFIVLVLSKKDLRTPTNYVLLAMALSELLTGLSCFPWLLYYYTFHGFETDQESGLPAFWCTMFPYMAFILPSIFHTIAIWLTVYLAVQRYIYICVPTLVHGYCTIRRSKQVILMICFTAVWIYAPDTFATYNRSLTEYDHKLNMRMKEFMISQKNKATGTIKLCVRMRTWFIGALGDDVYYFMVYGLHTIVDVKTDSDTKNNDNNNNKDHQNKKRELRVYRIKAGLSESKRVQGLKQNTRMLIVVILLFLVTEIPAALIFATHVGAVGLHIEAILKYYGLINKLLIVRNVLIVISYPFRFAIYCGMSQQFREVVQQMFTTKVYYYH